MSEYSPEQANARAAALLAEALTALRGSDNGALRDELRQTRESLDTLSRRLERHMDEERQHRDSLADQLGGLVSSLDRLVTHLQGMSTLMAEIFATAADQPETQPTPSEPAFMPGGEGVSLAIASVPGFQALMELQKALARMDELDGASVERYHEGDSRLLLHLRSAVTPPRVVDALQAATGFNIVVEESRPEVRSLRLRIV